MKTRFYLSYALTEQTLAKIAVNYLAINGYIPKTELELVQRFNFPLALTGGVSYGGFGNLDGSLGVALILKNKYLITTKGYYFENLIAPQKTSGQGFVYSFVVKF